MTLFFKVKKVPAWLNNVTCKLKGVDFFTKKGNPRLSYLKYETWLVGWMASCVGTPARLRWVRLVPVYSSDISPIRRVGRQDASSFMSWDSSSSRFFLLISSLDYNRIKTWRRRQLHKLLKERMHNWMYSITNKGWDFRDDCRETIYPCFHIYASLQL